MNFSIDIVEVQQKLLIRIPYQMILTFDRQVLLYYLFNSSFPLFNFWAKNSQVLRPQMLFLHVVQLEMINPTRIVLLNEFCL